MKRGNRPLVARRLVGLATAFVLAACSPTTPNPSNAVSAGTPAPSEQGSAAIAFTPRFAESPCPDDVTIVVVTAPTCGYLTVLEDRSKPGGRTIRIFVARFEPPGGTRTPDPMLVVGESLGAVVEYGGIAPLAQRTHRDVYLVDLRGIGHSEPNLDCPEVRAAAPDLAGLRLRDPAHRAALTAAVRACHDRLADAGIDLAAYDLEASAADLEDLRVALGIAQWNVVGFGNSSRIAFELASRFPAGLRALIADSPSLAAPDALTLAPAAFDQALDRLAAACSADPSCARRAPDLRTAIDQAVAQLDVKPVTLDVEETDAAKALGRPVRVVIDGAALLRWIRALLANDGGRQAGFVVRDVLRALDGRLTATDPIALALAADPGDCLGIVPGCERITFGALYSIECRDLAPAIDQAALDQAVHGRAAWADLFDPPFALAACDAWSVPPATRAPAGPPTAGLHALLMRGWFDPFTVPASRLAAATAGDSDATVLEIPNQSYNIFGFTECPRSIRSAWLDTASGPPSDITCLTQIPPTSLEP